MGNISELEIQNGLNAEEKLLQRTIMKNLIAGHQKVLLLRRRSSYLVKRFSS